MPARSVAVDATPARCAAVDAAPARTVAVDVGEPPDDADRSGVVGHRFIMEDSEGYRDP